LCCKKKGRKYLSFTPWVYSSDENIMLNVSGLLHPFSILRGWNIMLNSYFFVKNLILI
jgi:hypothetical protein